MKTLPNFIFKPHNSHGPLKRFLLIVWTMVSVLFAHGQVDFTADKTTGCSPLFVQFQGTAAGTPTSWVWDFGDGSAPLTLSTSSAVHTYTEAGIFNVKLKVVSPGGSDSIIKSNYITVFASPTAAFNADDTSGCFPFAVKFNDLSNANGGTITKWEWDFGDGTPILSGQGPSFQNPSHIYNLKGSFPVTLNVISSNGCKSNSTKLSYIDVADGVHADFDNSFPSACKPPVAISFFNKSTGPATLSYNWNFGDGGSATDKDPIHNYLSTGVFNISLQVTSSEGCLDTISKEVTITSDNIQTSITSTDTACLGQPVAFQNTSIPSPDSSFWDFGDGTKSLATNPSKSYNKLGNFLVKLRNIYGICSDTASKTIAVVNAPTANFTQTSPVSCKAPFNVQFTDNSPGAVSWAWDFGDGGRSSQQNPSYTFNKSGYFKVKLTITNRNGCTATVIKDSLVKIAAPKTRITNLPDSGCVPFTINPKTDITAVDGIASYFWDFGDGTTSTLASPSHSYATEGVYNLKLVITTNSGCTDSVTLLGGIKTGNKPTANFSATPTDLCAIDGVNFTDLTTGTVTGWKWEFGDGGRSTDRNPVYTYSDTGLFSVKLTAYNNGCASEITKKDYIRIRGAIARFKDSVDCSDKTQVYFKDQSINAATYSWDFGDGSPIQTTAGDKLHKFPGLGTYKVTLTVNGDGCNYVFEKTINLVDEKANYTVAPSPLCKGVTTFFTATGSNDANIKKYAWDFGNGIFVDSTRSAQFTYDTTGLFATRLKITDINGCSDSTLKNIRVGGPTTYFKALNPTGCKGLTVSFVDSSVTDGINAIASYFWDFGDGSSSTIQNPSHQFIKAGSYTIKLRVTDAAGCSDSLVIPNLVVASDPKADFTYQDSVTCPGNVIQFISKPTGAITSYSWSFGDGTTSNLRNPFYKYSGVGVYDVKLRVGDRFGCADSITKVGVIVVDTPYAAFNISDSLALCPPLQVKFTFTGKFNKSVRWEFGDGGASNKLDSVEHFYGIPGTYFAKLIVTSPGGCTDTAIKKITVLGPDGTVTINPQDGCRPLDVNFNLKTTFADSVLWDFGDGKGFISKDTILNHLYSDSGHFLPKIFVQDLTGCRVRIRGVDTIAVIGFEPKIGYDKTLFCDEGFVQFTDSTVTNGKITNWFWDFGDGNTSTDKDPLHFYQGQGLYTVRLRVTGDFGCTDTITYPNLIKVVNSPKAGIVSDTAICQLANISFQGVLLQPDTSALTWAWDFGNGQTSNLQDPPVQNYSGAGSYAVQLLVTNSSGCIDTVVKNILVNPLPITDAGADSTICLGQSIQLNPTGAVTYQWLPPATALSCTDCPQPIASPVINTLYKVKGISGFGCEYTDSVFIQVIQPSAVKAPEDAVVCYSQAIQLIATGTQLYTWTPADGLNNAFISSPVARPTQTTTYLITGSDAYHCFVTTDTVRVTVYPIPAIDAGPDITYTAGGRPIQLTPLISPDVTGIVWSPAEGLSCTTCPNPIASPKTTTTYNIKVTNEGGCTMEDQLTIFVVCTKGNLFIPNTFSPNGDGNNEVFYIRGTGIGNIKSLRIFNRWGQLVFERKNFNANEISSGWDGTLQGRQLPPDVYVYMAEITCENNTAITLKGDVTLIR